MEDMFEELAGGEEEERRIVDDDEYARSIHLDSPLSVEHLIDAIHETPYLTKSRRMCRNVFTDIAGIDRSEISTDIHSLIPYLSGRLGRMQSAPYFDYDMADRLCSKLLDVNPIKETMDPRIYSRSIWESARKYRTIAHHLQLIQMKRGATLQEYTTTDIVTYNLKDSLGIMVHSTKEYIFIHTDHWIIAEDDGYMMVMDTFLQRANALEYYSISTDLQRFRPTESIVNKLYNVMDAILMKGGNDAYAAIKYWEPIFIGRLISLEEAIVTNPYSFFTEMQNEFLSECEQIGTKKEGTYFIQLVVSISEKCVLSELFGLFRHFGHPYTFIELAMDKVKKITCTAKDIDHDVVDQVEAEFTYMIINGYFKKHRTHLAVNTDALPEKSEVRLALKEGRAPDTSNIDYRHIEWKHVEFLKNFDDGKDLDPQCVVQDKAISPPLSVMMKYIKRKRSPPWEIRRFMPEYLKMTIPSPYEFLKHVEENGLTRDDLVINYVKKERELNATPRIFAVQSINLKMTMGYLEHLTKRSVLPLIEECTMSDGTLTLQNKILPKVADQARKGEHVVVVINMDFMKWNLQFCTANTLPFFKKLDQLFGFTKMFSMTHTWFENIRFYHAGDGRYLTANNDDIDDSVYSWRGQFGGCEGLKQKPWTVITLALLRCVGNKFNVRFQLLGSGDNQVMTLYLPCPPGKTVSMLTTKERESMATKLGQIMTEIDVMSGRFGLPLKMTETWMSTSLFAFGKALYFDGVQLPMSAKKYGRASDAVNSDYLSLSTALQGQCTAAQAATASDYTPEAAFKLMVLNIVRTVRAFCKRGYLIKGGISEFLQNSAAYTTYGIKDKSASMLLTENHEELFVFCVLLGALNLGGAPVLNIWDLFSHGFADPLTCQISYLMELMKSDKLNPIERTVINNLICPVLANKKDMLMILQDPLSLNIDSSASITNILKRTVEGVLKSSSVKNPLIKEVMSIQDRELTPLANALATTRPFAPAPLGLILQSSVHGFCMQMVNSCKSTRSMIKLGRRYDVAIPHKLARAEEKEITSWVKQWFTKGSVTPNQCPTLTAYNYREKSWGVPVVGVTVPHPFHHLRRYPVTGGSCALPDSHDHIAVRFCDRSVVAPYTIFETLGPLKPYLGGKPSEKLESNKSWEVKTVPSAIRRQSKARRMVGWFIEPNSNLDKLMKKVFGVMSDVDPELFNTSLDDLNITGNWAHRLSDGFRKTTSTYSCLTGPLTHISIDTNAMHSIAKGKENYAVPFQNIMVTYLQVEVTSRLSRARVDPLTHYHLDCDKCLIKLPDNKMDCSSSNIVFTKLSENSPIFTKKEEILSSVVSKYKFYESCDIGRLHHRVQSNIVYTLIAKEMIDIVFKNPGKSISGNWFFGIDVDRLMCHVRTELLMQAHLEKAMTPKQGNHDYTPEMLVMIKVQAVPVEAFSGILNLFIDHSNYIQVSRSPVANTCMPAVHPPTNLSMMWMLKEMFMCKWAKIIPTLVVTRSDRDIKSIILRTIAVSLYMGWINPAWKFGKTVNHYVSNIRKRMNMDPDSNHQKMIENVVKGELLRESDPMVQTSWRTILDVLMVKTIYLNLGKDKAVKSVELTPVLSPFQAKRIEWEDPEPTKVSIYKHGYTSKLVFEDGNGRGGPTTYLSSSHGPILYSMLRGDDIIAEGPILIIGDGAGTTSLALSMRYLNTLKIVPYIAENAAMTQMVHLPPPEILVNNPATSVEVLTGLNGSAETWADTALRGVIFDVLFVDFDKPMWNSSNLNAILSLATERRLLMLLSNVSDRTVETVYGKISKHSSWSELRMTGIHGYSSYLVVADVKYSGITLASDEMKIVKKPNQLLSMAEIEMKMVRDIKSSQAQLRAKLSWLPGPNEATDLRFIMTCPDQVIKSSHTMSEFRRVEGMAMLNPVIAQYYFVLQSFLMLNIDPAIRYLEIPESGALYTFTGNITFDVKLDGEKRRKVTKRGSIMVASTTFPSKDTIEKIRELTEVFVYSIKKPLWWRPSRELLIKLKHRYTQENLSSKKDKEEVYSLIANNNVKVSRYIPELSKYCVWEE